MDKIYLVAWITFKNCLRHKALYGILLMALVLFGANIIFTGMFSWDITKAAVDFGLSTIAFSGLILIFFFSINMMSDDMEKKTIYLILSRPISKVQYILCKYAGLSTVILISSIVLGCCSAISVWLSIAMMGFDKVLPFTWSFFFLAVLFQTLSLLVMMALALLWVMITSHQFTAALLCLMTYFVGQNMENVKNIVVSRKMLDPDALSVKVMELASWIFPNLSAFNFKTAVAHGLEINPSMIIYTALYGVSYIGICLCLSIFFFKRKEL
ncbi:MAG: ABC transporter permease subunit [Desulfobacteraceae bacterium]|nr:ABC transporter permease subunit [Desulfobacteraceae bacterium]